MYVDVKKLNLLLTSGEHIDVIYAANYQNYAVYAAKGRLLPLDDLVPKVSPALQEYVSTEMADATRVGRESLHGALYVGGMGTLWLPFGGRI